MDKKFENRSVESKRRIIQYAINTVMALRGDVVENADVGNIYDKSIRELREMLDKLEE